ncbi:MAG TPA: hypothetical protein VG710_16930 [Opitutus sp.]|nr:hypothetical protein [Opitutus sp.]
MKNAIASKAAQTYANQRIARYGEVQDLRIDAQRKTIEVVCQLRGEAAPITVRVTGYALRDTPDGGKVLRLGPCTCDRPWLENLIADFAADRDIPVPTWAAAAL